MDRKFGLQDLYDVVLKTTLPIEVNGKTIQKGEVIAAFDKIMFANFNEIKSAISANGGFDNRALVIWQSTQQIELNLSQGVFSHTQLGLMVNSKLYENCGPLCDEFHQREKVTSDEDGNLLIKHAPNSELFIYDEDGERLDIPEEIECYETEEGLWRLELEGEPYTNLIVDYNFKYDGGTIMKIGKVLADSYFSFEGRTKVQDDITGKFRTGIIKIPKLKLMSDLSIRLGQESSPVVGTIKAIGLPVGTRGQQEVARIIFLDEDIDKCM